MTDNVSRETITEGTPGTPGDDTETITEGTPGTPGTPGDDTEDTEDTEDTDDTGELQQSFSRDYVERLRSRSASYRLRAKESEQQLTELQQALFRERVQRLDLVVDPVEVPYNAELLESEADLVEHIEGLLSAKPYLRKRKAGGDIGQHDTQQSGDGFSLLGALRANAG